MYIVQYVAWFVFIFMIIMTIINFKKSVLLWMPFHLLFNSMFALFFNPGVAIGVAVNTFQFVYYFLFVNGKVQKSYLNNEPFILQKAVGISVFSFVLSTLFATVPFSTCIIPSIKFFILSFCPLYLFGKALNTQDDLLFFIKCTSIVTVMIVSLGLVEFVLHDNPFLDMVYFWSPPGELEMQRMSYVPPFLFDYATNERFGLRRCYSFFGLHLTFGFACACIYMIYSYIYIKGNSFQKKWAALLMVFGLFGVFFSNSKQAILAVCTMFFAVYSPRDIFKVKIITPILIVIFAIVIYAPDFLLNFVSLIDADVAEEGGGSTVALRQSQSTFMWDLFMNNPLTGNGPGSNLWYVFNQESKYGGLMGSESIWLLIPSERGVLGIISYLMIFTVIWNKLKMQMDKRCLFFVLLSIFIAESAGGEKDMMLWGAMILFIYRFNYLQNMKFEIF